MSDIKRIVYAERERTLHIASYSNLPRLEVETQLEGYRIYIVEQWMCDRKAPANTVKVFTGDKSHIIKVCVIGVSTADLQHARPDVRALYPTNVRSIKYKSTPIGQIQLTDPSELPDDVDMVLVPDGDYDKWTKRAKVNINLRRTNCTGRSAFNLREPNSASEDKFRSLYKIADTVDFEDAVIKLVTIAQTALFLFGLLKQDYIDGLLCDETNRALGEFYRLYKPYKGTNYVIKDPWMEPHLLTALITKLMVCRNKMQAINFTTVKDPFTDWFEFSRDVGHFQRIKGLRENNVINLPTLKKLDDYNIGPLRVRKAIKSKLDDLSGIHNSPLLGEDCNPEIFRDHATIDSLRAIWRPRLRAHAPADDRSSNDFIHMIKEVSARTSKTSGVAAGMISKVAGSLSWPSPLERLTSTSTRHKMSASSSATVLPPQPTSPNAHSAISQHTSPAGSTPSIAEIDHPAAPEPAATGPPARQSEDPAPEEAKPTPLVVSDLPSYMQDGPSTAPVRPEPIRTSGHISLQAAASPILILPSHSPLTAPVPSAPSSVHGTTGAGAATTTPLIPSLPPSATPGMSMEAVATPSPAHDTPMAATPSVSPPNQADFVRCDYPRPRPYHRRSVSTNDIPTIRQAAAQAANAAGDASDGENHANGTLIDPPLSRTSSSMFSLLFGGAEDELHHTHADVHAMAATSTTTTSTNIIAPATGAHPRVMRRRRSCSDMATATNAIAHESWMDPATYLVYERLRAQHAQLQQKYTQLHRLAADYEAIAKRLRNTYNRRHTEFEAIERQFKVVADDQHEFEKNLKHVENESAKLHYELNVLNDSLQEREENVRGFYSKLEVLERKMKDDQSSLTTMFIIANYFRYYWHKIARFWTPPPPSAPSSASSASSSAVAS
ncbi:hypothetical protein BC940DRAFT_291078 [Gongronella butleri]|nr:hypothetical protein BC940DRAFT_291078 [Gongronella butleri]